MFRQFEVVEGARNVIGRGRHVGAEGVDGGLEHHVGDGEHAGLYARRQPHGEYAPKDRQADGKIPPHKLVDVIRPGEQPKRQRCSAW